MCHRHIREAVGSHANAHRARSTLLCRNMLSVWPRWCPLFINVPRAVCGPSVRQGWVTRAGSGCAGTGGKLLRREDAHHLAGCGVFGDGGSETDAGGALASGVHRPGGDVAYVSQQLRLGHTRIPCKTSLSISPLSSTATRCAHLPTENQLRAVSAGLTVLIDCLAVLLCSQLPLQMGSRV